MATRIADYLDQAITETRQLSRGLFPVRLADEGLPPALEELARATSNRFQVSCRFTCQGPIEVESIVAATHLYRIAQEALNNAIKHARAQTISIRLCARAQALELTVEDDGSGIANAAMLKSTGLGLHIMNYRARSIGGALKVGHRDARGTVVSCCVPAPAAKQLSS